MKIPPLHYQSSVPIERLQNTLSFLALFIFHSRQYECERKSLGGRIFFVACERIEVLDTSSLIGFET